MRINFAADSSTEHLPAAFATQGHFFVSHSAVMQSDMITAWTKEVRSILDTHSALYCCGGGDLQDSSLLTAWLVAVVTP
jgi:hypothetical protein